MKIKEVGIKDGAVFIADVHYKKGDIEFLKLLQDWLKSPPSQIFFLGDIFHLLLPFKFLIDYNKEAIDLIKELSLKTEVYYAYGNHDFNIDKVFGNVIFADAFIDEEKSIFLAHGDLNEKNMIYKIYAKIIRNKVVIYLLNLVTLNLINDWIFKKILQKKVKCCKISFEEKVLKKIADIKYRNIVEGHYHQNRVIKSNKKIYINLGAFRCEKVFYLFEDFTIKEIHGIRQNFKSRLK